VVLSSKRTKYSDFVRGKARFYVPPGCGKIKRGTGALISTRRMRNGRAEGSGKRL
jgi:hypothetical protein